MGGVTFFLPGILCGGRTGLAGGGTCPITGCCDRCSFPTSLDSTFLGSPLRVCGVCVCALQAGRASMAAAATAAITG